MNNYILQIKQGTRASYIPYNTKEDLFQGIKNTLKSTIKTGKVVKFGKSIDAWPLSKVEILLIVHDHDRIIFPGNCLELEKLLEQQQL